MSHDFLDRRSNTSGSSRNNANEGPAPTHEMLREYLEQRMRRNEMLTAQMFARDEEDDKRQVQQKVSDEESLQRKGEPGQGTTTSMPADVQGKMENSFGTDFSGVNIHKDSEQANALGAFAYTQGSDVHFAPGQYNPGSQKGQELIGHELTHVVQQREGRVKPDAQQHKGVNINSDPALEKEADDMGAKAAQGKMADVKKKGSGVQRKEVNEETGGINNVNKESSNVGDYTWQQTDSIIGWWHDYQITVKNRSVEEWKNFLINEADSREGGIELNLYLGTALYGKNAFYNSLTADHATEIKLTDYVKDSGIVQPENLMVALLTVGDKMDLQDSPYEGGGSRISKDSLLKLINGFTAKYSAQALMSQSYEEFNDDNIKDFLEASVGDGFNSGAAYFGDEFNYGDVHVKLINGALAAAFGHMNELACLAAKYPDEKGVEKNALKTQVKNMGKTVQTAIKTIKNLKTRQASINLAVFESILAIGTAGVGTQISGAVKSMLFAGATELAKIGLKSLVGVSDEGKRIEAYEKDFEMAFEKVLKEVYSNSELEKSQKGDIDTELGFAKLHFLSGLDD